MLGSRQGSIRYTVDAAVRVIPTAPVLMVITNTLVAAFLVESASQSVADDDEDDEVDDVLL